MAETATNLIERAFEYIGIGMPGETLSADHKDIGLKTLKSMLRSWSAQSLMIHTVTIENFTLTSGTSSYTIGSGGDFDTTRPVKINGGYVQSGGLDCTLRIIGKQKYLEVTQKSQVDTPAWLYYNPSFGANERGTVYLYPTGGGTIYLYNQRPLSEPTNISADVVIPPEYEEAIETNLAVRLGVKFGRMIDLDLRSLALASKDHVISINAALQHEPVKLEILTTNQRWSIDGG